MGPRRIENPVFIGYGRINMMFESYNTDEMIAALATPWGQSALAVIRTSGKGSRAAVAEIFSEKKDLLEAAGYTLVRGYLIHPEKGIGVDEVIAAVYREPKSYTGEESVELFLHGSLPGIKWSLDALKLAGFRDASPGEFTLRAFLNKKMDLTRAEAVHEIVTAKTLKSQSLALSRLSGKIEKKINEIKLSVLEIMAAAELQLDYPEDESEVHDLNGYLPVLREKRKEIADLADTFRVGKVYQEGIRAVFAGKTNAGKSSLFNLFLREDRAIVSDIHGTTRDYIESWITIGGIPVSLFDTAGLRKASNPVEMEGIKRSEQVIENAQIVMYIVDACEGLSREDDEFLAGYKRRGNVIGVWNKIDLSSRPCPKGFFPVSAATGNGFNRIEAEISRIAIGKETRIEDVVIDSERQKDLLERAAGGLFNVIEGIEGGVPVDALTVDLKEVLDGLGEITGEVTSADVLETMFSRFCVGK